MKPLARYLEERGLTVEELASASGLGRKLVEAIVRGNHTPGPAHRELIAGALGLTVEEVSWDHAVPVEHMRGNGPQFGRST